MTRFLSGVLRNHNSISVMSKLKNIRLIDHSKRGISMRLMDDDVLSAFSETDMPLFPPGASRSSTFTLALAGIAARLFQRVVLALRNRHQVARLTDLDDRALKDIGLLRTDVYAALAGPLYQDPSIHLIDVAGYKREIRVGPHAGKIDAAVVVPGSETLRRPSRQGFLRHADPAVKTEGATPIAC